MSRKTRGTAAADHVDYEIFYNFFLQYTAYRIRGDRITIWLLNFFCRLTGYAHYTRKVWVQATQVYSNGKGIPRNALVYMRFRRQVLGEKNRILCPKLNRYSPRTKHGERTGNSHDFHYRSSLRAVFAIRMCTRRMRRMRYPAGA